MSLHMPKEEEEFYEKQRKEHLSREEHGKAIRRRKALNRPWHLYEMDKPTKERKCQSERQ